MVGPIDMQSVILNSYAQSNVNNNLLLQVAQADSIKRIAQKKDQDEANTKVESAQESENPNIHEHLSKKENPQDDAKNTKKHIDIKV
jgi:ABC-type Zn2+ transport system substrate-binding protein/surface adhesin